MDVHSKDEQTWSTKLKRIGKRDKGTVFNNMGCVIDLDMLKETYHSLEENKASGLDKMTKENTHAPMSSAQPKTVTIP